MAWLSEYNNGMMMSKFTAFRVKVHGDQVFVYQEINPAKPKDGVIVFPMDEKEVKVFVWNIHPNGLEEWGRFIWEKN